MPLNKPGEAPDDNQLPSGVAAVLAHPEHRKPYSIGAQGVTVWTIVACCFGATAAIIGVSIARHPGGSLLLLLAPLLPVVALGLLAFMALSLHFRRSALNRRVARSAGRAKALRQELQRLSDSLEKGRDQQSSARP